MPQAHHIFKQLNKFFAALSKAALNVYHRIFVINGKLVVILAIMLNFVRYCATIYIIKMSHSFSSLLVNNYKRQHLHFP
jgi:hypothetical protein